MSAPIGKAIDLTKNLLLTLLTCIPNARQHCHLTDNHLITILMPCIEGWALRYIVFYLKKKHCISDYIVLLYISSHATYAKKNPHPNLAAKSHDLECYATCKKKKRGRLPRNLADRSPFFSLCL